MKTRKIRAALAAAAVVVGLAGVVGGGDAKARNLPNERLPVLYYGDDVYRPYVEVAVAQMNATMPRSGPNLVFVDKPEKPCAQAWRDAPEKGLRAVVCTPPSLANSYLGQTWSDDRGGMLYLSESVFDDWRANTACHEFMHLLAQVPDRYDSDPNSCIWGRLGSPGPTDVVLLAQAYAKPKPKAAPPKTGKKRGHKRGTRRR